MVDDKIVSMLKQFQEILYGVLEKCKKCILGSSEMLLIPLRIVNAVILALAGAWIKEFCCYAAKAFAMPLSDWTIILQGGHRNLAIFYIIAVVAILVQLILEIRNVRTIGKLRDELSDAENTIATQKQEVEDARILKNNVSAIVKLYLSATSKALKMTAAERISFYVLNDDRQTFSISARDSENAEYQVYKRDTFSANEGIIGLAHTTGQAFENNLPSFEKDQKGYLKECKKRFKLKAEVVKSLSMKARFYYAFRFSAHDHNDFNSVVVVESMNPVFKTKLELNDIFVPDNEFVYMLVKNFGKCLPKIDLARKKGL